MYRPTKVNCSQCFDLGYIKDPEPAMNEFGQYPCGVMMPCPACSADERAQWLLRYCGIEGRMQGKRLGDWVLDDIKDPKSRRQRTNALQAMRAAIESRCGLHTFYGDFGSGKTLALSIACNELRCQMVETYYTTLAAVLDHLRNLYSRNEDTSNYWERLLNVPVLALDEITRFKETEWAHEKLFTLAHKRHERLDSHLTLFASNDDVMQPIQPDKALGYLFSRMREKGNTVVELRGDMRPVVSG